MHANTEYLGILDWGIGGLGLYNSVKALALNYPILYFSDAGATPYGKMSHAQMQARLETVLNFMHSLGALNVAVACNAASCALPIQVQCNYTGIIEHGIKAVQQKNPKQIGIIGGERTINSNSYLNPLSSNAFDVLQQVAQPLSNLIEQGDTTSKELEIVAKNILLPLKGCSHLLLGCTHYPAISPIIGSILGPEVELIDPIETMAKWIKTNWHLPLQSTTPDRFVTTGNIERMKFAAKKVFNVSIKNVQSANF